MFARSFFSAGFGTAFTMLMVSAMVWDLKQRRIPNLLVAMTIVLGVAFAAMTFGAARGAAVALEGVAVGLALWLPWWWLGMMGAGDVKFFAAAAAWLGPRGALGAAAIAALFGGLLGLGWVLARAVGRRRADNTTTAVADTSSGEPHASFTLPYGVAMALGLGVAAWIPLIR